MFMRQKKIAFAAVLAEMAHDYFEFRETDSLESLLKFLLFPVEIIWNIVY